jgi:hypothetical protein
MIDRHNVQAATGASSDHTGTCWRSMFPRKLCTLMPHSIHLKMIDRHNVQAATGASSNHTGTCWRSMFPRKLCTLMPHSIHLKALNLPHSDVVDTTFLAETAADPSCEF